MFPAKLRALEAGNRGRDYELDLHAFKKDAQQSKAENEVPAMRDSETPAAPCDQSDANPSGNQADANPVKSACPALHNGPERRERKRASMRLPARIRSSNIAVADIEEVLMTVNASRHGLYFVTTSDQYYAGMHLRITFPYHSEHDSLTASAESGEVVRMVSLGGERTGIAVRLHSQHEAGQEVKKPIAVIKNELGTGGQAIKENRGDARHPLMATATLVDPSSGICLEARSSDLSLGGCYVDTLNPFRQGTAVELRLTQGARILELAAQVAVCHMGMGMGLSFDALTSEQTSELITWTSGDCDEHAPVSAPADAASKPASRNQDQRKAASGLCLL